MTSALYDEVVTARTLPVVRDTSAAPAPRKVTRTPVVGGDPLVDAAARVLSIPLRHLYAVLWRAGVLEVQA
jgi:hypothetical protein